jgi:hypothetical protein
MAKYVGFRQGKVHESHVISEYYCGGCGWPVTDHDSFCPECGGAFRKCDADDESIRRLEAENAKLREYAESYAKVVEGEGCGWCPYDMDALCDIETMPMRDGCKLYDELRKLGIEVGR